MAPPDWTHNELTVNGASLHYVRTGDGSKPPLVLVHGFSDDGLCWAQTARELEDRYDIVMPDARGHGGSARIQPGERVDMAADLAGLIQALELRRPIVAGHSMGAMEAFQLGVRYPSIARALLLEDPPWWQPEASQPASPPQEHPMQPWVDTITRLSLDELIAETRAEHPGWPEWVIETWCPAKKRVDPNILSILDIAGSDWPAGVAQLAVPTLLVTGDPERGSIVTPEIAARAQAINPLCTLAHMPGAGHHIRFEAYEPYMRSVHAFLHGLS